ncbi:MAG: DNA recombination protein RmuC [Candidatus Zixiibacteriota bacterium]
MDTLTTVIIIFLAVNLLLTLWLIVSWRRQKSADPRQAIETALATLKADLIAKQMDGLISLRESLDSANRLLNDRLAEGTQTLDRRMSVINEIENKLGKLSTQTSNIETIGKNIQSLSELLKPPKLRGSLGEILLENLLGQILPKQLFEIQHKFDDGARVDAVVKLSDKLLPIDSKFPLESYNRIASSDSDNTAKSARKEFATAIKKHIDDIASKYIRTGQNTTDFAVMYIPSEAVYYQLVAGESLDEFDYAMARKVIPSSPGHLYGFLASVAAVYSEAGLGSNRRLLSECLDSITASIEKLAHLNERMNGSLRAASLSLEKSRDEVTSMTRHLERLKHPSADSDTNSTLL